MRMLECPTSRFSMHRMQRGLEHEDIVSNRNPTHCTILKLSTIYTLSVLSLIFLFIETLAALNAAAGQNCLKKLQLTGMRAQWLSSLIC